MSANERQVGGEHYRKVPGEQHWDRQWRLFGRGYFIGCITGYAERYVDKNGLEDLEKMIHFGQKLLELERAALDGTGPPPGGGDAPLSGGKPIIELHPHPPTEQTIQEFKKALERLPQFPIIQVPTGPPKPNPLAHPSHVWKEDKAQTRCTDCGAYRDLSSGMELCPNKTLWCLACELYFEIWEAKYTGVGKEIRSAFCPKCDTEMDWVKRLGLEDPEGRVYHAKSTQQTGFMKCGVPMSDGWWADDRENVTCKGCLDRIIKEQVERVGEPGFVSPQKSSPEPEDK